MAAKIHFFIETTKKKKKKDRTGLKNPWNSLRKSFLSPIGATLLIIALRVFLPGYWLSKTCLNLIFKMYLLSEEIPQISLRPGREKSHRFHRWTQISLRPVRPRIRESRRFRRWRRFFWPIRSWWRRFFLYILYADETYSVRLRRFFDSPALFPCRGQKPKGLAESAYATELRLFDA